MKPANRVFWKLSVPYEGTVNFVITSAVNVNGTSPETYVFTASKDGKVTSYKELPGSLRGALDHDRAFKQFCKATGCKGEKVPRAN
jgi:hypothetical protein